MEQWQPNPTTTPPQETQHEPKSPPPNESTADEVEGTLKLLTGQLLKQLCYLTSFQMLLVEERQSSLGTPVMEVHLSSALLAMASLTMSMCDLLRTYLYTWRDLPPISLNEAAIFETLWRAEEIIDEVLTSTDIS